MESLKVKCACKLHQPVSAVLASDADDCLSPPEGPFPPVIKPHSYDLTKCHICNQ